jgi:hypothetical protein
MQAEPRRICEGGQDFARVSCSEPSLRLLTRGKMFIRRPLHKFVAALLVTTALTACANNAPQLPSLGVQPDADTAATSVAASPSGAAGAGDTAPAGTPVPGAVGSTTDIYSNIARGAMACWFAVSGPLKKNYIFHAAADAPSRGGGGKAVVTIHERDTTQPNPRGPKAYVVEILPTGESTAHVTVENRKMPDAYAAAMRDDISRWSKGEEGCSGATTASAWPPMPGEPATATPKSTPPKAKKAKTKVKAAQAKPAAQSTTQP